MKNDLPKTKRPFPWKRRAFQVVLLGAAFLLALGMSSATRPKNLGTVGGVLTKCPDSQNCVSSTAERDSQRMPALVFEGTTKQAMDKLLTIINEMPRATVINQSETYVYVEFRSLIFRFVDDVEFLLDTENKKIDFRSASRVGYSDLGANRRRMKTISQRFQQ